MPSKHIRGHVNRFCEGCGQEEFEGYVFGKYWKEVKLTAQADGSGMLCERCAKLKAAGVKLIPHNIKEATAQASKENRYRRHNQKRDFLKEHQASAARIQEIMNRR